MGVVVAETLQVLEEPLTKTTHPGQALIPSAQRFVWAANQPLGNAALGALFA